jgi:gliding motility-associated-like protein
MGNGDSLHSLQGEYSYTQTGNYKIVQWLKGTSGCITSDTAWVHVLKGFETGAKPEIMTAGYDSTDRILVQWKALSGAKNYFLYRAQGDGPSQLYKSLSPSETSFEDSSKEAVHPGKGYQVSYRLKALDSCGGLLDYSNTGRPMQLYMENVENKFNILHWYAYREWRSGVAAYHIERRQPDGVYRDIEIQKDTAYNDREAYDHNEEMQCYCIRAEEQGGNGSLSYSNKVCVSAMPMVWVPDVFSPNNDSLNDNFIIKGIGIRSLCLKIYNRWGEVVHEECGSSVQWDGKMKNEEAAMGTYIYSLEVTARSGEKFYRKGSLQLLR